MGDIAVKTIEDVLGLQDLASAIRRESNVRFAWQFYRIDTDVVDSAATFARVLDLTLTTPELHSFLAADFAEFYAPAFRIGSLHRHASIVESPALFLDTVTRARLGRYGLSTENFTPVTRQERGFVPNLFLQLGRFSVVTTSPGTDPSCDVCRDSNNHLFSSWFRSDFSNDAFLVVWPGNSLAWMGCLTDTAD